MKRALLLAAILLPGVIIAQSGKDYYEVVRGSRSGGGCVGNKSGICEIKPARMGTTNTRIFGYNENQILLSIDLLKISEEEQVAWLGLPIQKMTSSEEYYFVQEEPLEIDMEVMKSLNIDSKNKFISAGKHSARLSDENRIEIVLSLSEKR